MKKYLALIFVLAIITQTLSVTAAKGGTGQAPVTFYVSRWGTQFDTEGNIDSRDSIYFSDIVYSTNLNQQMDITESIVIGKNVTEADILGRLNNEPQDDVVFKKLFHDYKKDGALLYTNTKKLIDWDDFDATNYGIMWYVLKTEDDGWHVDGYVYDLITNDNVNIVLPDEKDEFGDFVGGDVEVEPEVDTSIHLDGAKYAYIFGYEPAIRVVHDETTGESYTTAEINMAMDDVVTREQVSAMLVRVLDQAGYTKGKSFPMVNAVRPHIGQWYERGLLYLCSVGGFDTEQPIGTAPIKRGEVAKLVSCALELNLSAGTPFNDIDDSPYKNYIEKVYKYGYMKGSSDSSFNPNGVMTRAEFCSLFNNILSRDDYELIAKNENGEEYEIKAKDYYFVDMDESHWAYETCLKATSAYSDDGYVDVVARNANIRNIIDRYDAQKKY